MGNKQWTENRTFSANTYYCRQEERRVESVLTLPYRVPSLPMYAAHRARQHAFVFALEPVVLRLQAWGSLSIRCIGLTHKFFAGSSNPRFGSGC